MNTLYSVAAIGFGLGIYEGRIMPLLLAEAAYARGYAIARRMDND